MQNEELETLQKRLEARVRCFEDFESRASDFEEGEYEQTERVLLREIKNLRERINLLKEKN